MNNNNSTPTLPNIYIHNVRSLNHQKHAELEVISGDYDIIFLTESWLNKNKEKVFSIRGFDLHTTHRQQRRCGGVAVYVRQSLSIVKHSSYTDEKVSTCWFRLHQPNYNPVLFGVIYHPPSLTKAEKEKTLDHIVSTISSCIGKYPRCKTFICGDFNDLETSDITLLFPFVQLVDFPTREGNILDMAFTDIQEYISVGCGKEPPIATNDHCAISIKSTYCKPAARYKTIRKHCITPNAKAKITERLQSMSWQFLYDIPDIHQKVETFQSTLRYIFDECCPVRSYRVPMEKPCFMTPTVKKLHRAKKRAHKGNKPTFKYLSKTLSAMIMSQRRKLTNQTINSCSHGTKHWWKHLKRLSGSIKSCDSPPCINIDGKWLSNDEFASQINEYFTERQNETEILFPHVSLCEDIQPPVTEYEVFGLLENINTSKANSDEDYPSWLTKNNSHLLCTPIHHIMATMLDESKFPDLWKKAQVNPIPKNKNSTSFKDFRPISLLFHLGKVAEKIILSRMRQRMDTFHNQFAYTPGLGTTDALVKFVSDITKLLDDKHILSVRAVMLDFSKAFDRMYPDITITRLVERHSPAIRTISSFFHNRKQCVRYNGSKTMYKGSLIGVPQGTILGPTLWNTFIDDLSPSVPHIKYADDTTIYASVVKADVELINSTPHHVTVPSPSFDIQRALDETHNWCNLNHMALNITKSNSITFSLQQTILDRPLNINGKAIDKVDNVKLLGVVFDSHLRFSSHVDSIIQKVRPSIYALLTLKRHGVSDAGLVMFYTTVIRSVLLYCLSRLVPLYISGRHVQAGEGTKLVPENNLTKYRTL